MADTRSNPMSASLAGIVSDPDDASRRIVPSSQRADGSTRKERKVRPGHVPAEDVAKYRPGQGSLRAQHVAAQANHQAPPSPSPAPASTIRRPNPSDFLTDSKLKEQQQQQPPSPADTAAFLPPPSPTKPSKTSGASSSRWAAAPSEPTPGPAPAPASSIVTPTSPRLGSKPQQRTRTAVGNRKGKTSSGTQKHTQAETAAHSSEAESQPEATPVTEQEAAKENVPPPEVPSTSTTAEPITPKSKIPDLPETPGGDWWEEEDEDDEVDAAAQALQGISIKDAASQQRAASPTPPASTGSRTQAQQHHDQGLSGRQNNGNHAATRESHPRNAKKPPQHVAKLPNASKSSSGDLLSRLGPPVPPQAVPVTTASAVIASVDTSKMTLEELRTKARSISQEIRHSNQLQRYAGAGAVLSDDQKQQIDKSHDLVKELNGLKAVADRLVDELSQLIEASRL